MNSNRVQKKAELNPCLCGGNPQHIKLFPKIRYDCFFKCDKCGYETKVYVSKQNAVKAWNKRNTPKVSDKQ